MPTRAFLAHCTCEGEVCTCDHRYDFLNTSSSNKDIAMPTINDKVAGILGEIAKLHTSEYQQLEKSLSAATVRANAISKDNRRAEKMRAAAADELNKPMIHWVNGQLRKIGVDMHAAADVHKLDEALTKARTSVETRIELKSALAKLGVID
jgi:hypothetical protein